MAARFGSISTPLFNGKPAISWTTTATIQSLREQDITFFSPDFVLGNVIWYFTVEPKTKDGFFRVSLVFSPLENFHLDEIRVDKINFVPNKCLSYGTPVREKTKVKVHTGKNKGASGVVREVADGLIEVELPSGEIQTHTITELEYVEQTDEEPVKRKKKSPKQVRKDISPKDTSVLLAKQQCAHYLFHVDEDHPSYSNQVFYVQHLQLEVLKSSVLYSSFTVDVLFILDSFFKIYTGRHDLRTVKLIVAFGI